MSGYPSAVALPIEPLPEILSAMAASQGQHNDQALKDYLPKDEAQARAVLVAAYQAIVAQARIALRTQQHEPEAQQLVSVLRVPAVCVESEVAPVEHVKGYNACRAETLRHNNVSSRAVAPSANVHAVVLGSFLTEQGELSPAMLAWLGSEVSDDLVQHALEQWRTVASQATGEQAKKVVFPAEKALAWLAANRESCWARCYCAVHGIGLNDESMPANPGCFDLQETPVTPVLRWQHPVTKQTSSETFSDVVAAARHAAEKLKLPV